MLREAKHSRSRRTPCSHTAAMAMQGILTTQVPGRTPCSACAARGSVGVFRLHVSRASRETHYAQDDRFYLTSTDLFNLDIQHLSRVIPQNVDNFHHHRVFARLNILMLHRELQLRTLPRAVRLPLVMKCVILKVP